MAYITALPVPTAPPEVGEAIERDYRLGQFRMLAAEFDIRPDFAERVLALENFDLVVVCDDSSSMLFIGSLRNLFVDGRLIERPTRWDELRRIVRIVTRFAVTMDPDGVGVYFLNRPVVRGVRAFDNVAPSFAVPPMGSTPLVRTLDQVIRDYASAERKVVVFVATDGLPDEGIDQLKHRIQTLPAHMSMTILACTNEVPVLNALNDIDATCDRVDVVDDYEHEREEVLRAQGRDFLFSFGDYVVKAMVGSMDPYLDNLDEKSLVGASCCSVC